MLLDLSLLEEWLLKCLFHPAFLAHVLSWLAFVVAIFMAHENGDKQRQTKGRHVQGMMDETDPLTRKFVRLATRMVLNLCFVVHESTLEWTCPIVLQERKRPERDDLS